MVLGKKQEPLETEVENMAITIPERDRDNEQFRMAWRKAGAILVKYYLSLVEPSELAEFDYEDEDAVVQAMVDDLFFNNDDLTGDGVREIVAARASGEALRVSAPTGLGRGYTFTETIARGW